MSNLGEIANKLKTERFESGASVYHPIPFDEFEDVSTSSDKRSALKKWELIKSALVSRIDLCGSRVLDVGANAGFYSFNMAKAGAKVEAYEPHEHYAKLGVLIADTTGLEVQWHNKKIEFSDIRDNYDITLMLSVFQWMSQGNAQLDEATDMLQCIASASRYLFFELGCNDGKSAIEVEGSQLIWLYNFLKKTTAPKQVTWLGITSAWGSYKRHMFICSEEKVNTNIWQQITTKFLSHRIPIK